MQTKAYASSYGKALTGLLVVVAAVTTATTLIDGDAGDLWLIPFTWALAMGGWMVLWRPQVALSRAGLRIVNVSRTIEVPWDAVRRIQTRWSLEVQTSERTWVAWAAPRGSAAGAVVRRVRNRGADEEPGEPRGASAENVAAAIQGWPRDERDAGASTETVTWHTRSLAALSGLAALAVALAVVA